jgi:hypothetical protein
MVTKLGIPRRLGQQLCQAWGLNPELVESIAITITADNLPKVAVVMLADERVERVLRRYELIEDTTRE